MLVPASPSPQEYLTRERLAKDKHEYYEGNITALAKEWGAGARKSVPQKDALLGARIL